MACLAIAMGAGLGHSPRASGDEVHPSGSTAYQMITGDESLQIAGVKALIRVGVMEVDRG
jgi:hypothetical protein